MRHTTRIILASAAATLAVLGLASCSGTAAATPVGSWGEPDTAGETSLEFAEDGSYSGSDGCNRVMGSWVADGELFSIAPMATTLMACEGVDVWLEDPASVRLDGTTLVVLDSSGAEIGTLQRS